MIIGLAGRARSGKDTVAKYLSTKYGFKQYAIADKVREACEALDPYVMMNDGEVHRLSDVIFTIGWEKAKQHSDIRRLLQRMGTEVGREMFGEWFWVDQVLNAIEEDRTNGIDLFVISDIRFENETDECSLNLKIERADIPKINNHKSENNIPDEFFQHIIQNNDSIEDLCFKIDSILSTKSGSNSIG